MDKSKLKPLLQVFVILVCAATVKYYYSKANVNDLRWILAPTTFAVEIATGAEFRYEPYSGYLKSDRTFLIAASCSGINFLITAFLLLTIRRLWQLRLAGFKWQYLLFAGLIAYFTTIVANAVRISTALQMQWLALENGGFNPNQLHLMGGIVVYFGFLLLLYAISEKVHSKSSNKPTPRSSQIGSFLIPLAIYYLIVLGIPLVNGAYKQGNVFWEHLLFVLFTPLVVVLPFATIKFVVRTAGRES